MSSAGSQPAAGRAGPSVGGRGGRAGDVAPSLEGKTPGRRSKQEGRVVFFLSDRAAHGWLPALRRREDGGGVASCDLPAVAARQTARRHSGTIRPTQRWQRREINRDALGERGGGASFPLCSSRVPESHWLDGVDTDGHLHVLVDISNRRTATVHPLRYQSALMC